MIIRNVLIGVTVLLFILLTSKCKHDPDELKNGDIIPNDTIPVLSCNPDTIYFQNDVLPLLVSSCASTGCHDVASAKDGVILVDYLSVIQTGEVKAGDPFDSELFEKIIDNDPEERMPPPPSNQLTTEQQDMIKKWIEQGARNTYCDSDCDTNNVTFSASVWPMININCTGCHNGSSAGGGVQITNYNDVVAIADNGSLLGTISHSSGYNPMPKNGNKLSDCKIDVVRIWIDNGTPNN